MWRQIISPSLLKLRQEIVGPICVVYLEAVTEDGVRRCISKSLQQRLRNDAQVILDGSAAEVVQHETLGVDGRALYLLSCSACNETQNNAPLLRRRKLRPPTHRVYFDLL